MSAATRLGDKDSGHDLCPPRPLVSASPNVFINKIPAGRVGDSYAAHGCKDHAAHTGTIATGSCSVFINGIPAGRMDDMVSCGGIVAIASNNVFIGG